MVDFTKDNNWVLERKDGLFKKYRRKLLNEKIGHNDLLGISEYTTPTGKKCKVYCRKYTEGKYAELTIQVVFEYLGKQYYICPDNFGRTAWVCFTQHAIDRMKERGNITFEQALDMMTRETGGTLAFTQNTYSGGPNDCMAYFADGLLLGVMEGSNFIIKTYINRKNEYANQLEVHIDSRKHAQKFSQEKNDFIDKSAIRNRYNTYLVKAA